MQRLGAAPREAAGCRWCTRRLQADAAAGKPWPTSLSRSATTTSATLMEPGAPLPQPQLRPAPARWLPPISVTQAAASWCTAITSAISLRAFTTKAQETLATEPGFSLTTPQWFSTATAPQKWREGTSRSWGCTTTTAASTR